MINTTLEKLIGAVPCRAGIGVHVIRIAIFDDNKPFAALLRDQIRTILDRQKVAAEIHILDGAETLPDQLLSGCHFCFLDIDFAEKPYNGLDIAKKVRAHNTNAIIIFVTNFIEYAPEGYEVQAFRYLLKKDIAKKLEPCLLQGLEKLQTEQKAVELNLHGEVCRIPVSNILYIESQGHHALLYTYKPGGDDIRSYRFYTSLSNLEEELSSQGFLRIQKRYLVNVRHIKSLQSTKVLLKSGQMLPVSKINYAELKKNYLLWKGRL